MSKRNEERDISEAIRTLARQIAKALRYADATFDRTFLTPVKTVNGDGTYTILDEYGSERVCVLALPSVVLEVGQRVYVTIPQNNLNKMYISGIYPQTNRERRIDS